MSALIIIVIVIAILILVPVIMYYSHRHKGDFGDCKAPLQLCNEKCYNPNENKCYKGTVIAKNKPCANGLCYENQICAFGKCAECGWGAAVCGNKCVSLEHSGDTLPTGCVWADPSVH